MATLAPTAMHHRAELIERAAAAASVREVFAAASARLRRLVPHDACVWAALDPATTLPTAPTRAENMAAFGDRRTARARMRSNATGRWLVCHASCMHDADGEIGNAALVIEHAKASEIAPIIT